MSASVLVEIAHKQDEKILGYLENKTHEHFWYASCPMAGSQDEQFRELHDLGFDNYPTAQIAAVDALRPYLFFFERMLGAEVEGNDWDFFNAWCRPILDGPDSVFCIEADPSNSPLWQAYQTAIENHLNDTPEDERLPVAFPGFSPLDIACNLCGAETFFVMLYEEPEAAEHLLDTIVTLAVEVHQRVQALGVRIVSPHGFPGVYCNDLQMPSLSPPHIKRLMLPRYARIAQECGGLTMALLTPDTGVVESAMEIDGLIGCLFDKSLPLSTIKRAIGHKLFVIPNYCYDEALDRPTFRDGIWWNPIVGSYSRELPEVFSEIAGECSMLVTIERPTLAEVCAERDALLSS